MTGVGKCISQRSVALIAAAALALSACTLDPNRIDYSKVGKPMKSGSLGGCIPRIYDTAPYLNSGRQPLYPITRVMEGKDGAAEALFTVNTDGTLSDIQVKSEAYKYFASHFRYALDTWDVTPAMSKGEAVQVRCYFRMNYKMR